MIYQKIVILFTSILLASCGSGSILNNNQQPALKLKPLEFTQIHSWHYNDFEHSLAAFQKSCPQIYRTKRQTILKKHPYFGSQEDWKSLCQTARKVPLYNAKSFFEQSFQPVLVDNNNKQGIFTGYYIPELSGSYTPSEQYRYPLYARPSKRKGLPPRSQIVQGALNDIAKPILWVDSEIDSFFLHIQGSGNVRLPNNQTVHVAYAGQNGHKYYAIGRHLIETDQIPREEMSAQAIKQWLHNNPEHAQSVMNLNPSYVFFKLDENQKQAKGAANVPLTAEYSLAVDHKYYPYGLPIWIETNVQVPIESSLQTMAFERLMIAQDTGGAIKGAVRGDIFFGSGRTAEIMASEQKGSGHQYLLLPRVAINKT